MNTLEFNHTISSDVTIFINGECVGEVTFNKGAKVSPVKFTHTATFNLNGKETELYATSHEDCLLKVRKYLLDYDCYELY